MGSMCNFTLNWNIHLYQFHQWGNRLAMEQEKLTD